MATKKNNNTLLYAGLGLAAFMLLRRNTDGVSGIGAKYDYVVGKVISVRYRNSSNYGNPSYWVKIETPDGEVISGYTSPNASIAYGINNPEYKREFHTFAITWGVNGAIFHYEQ